MSRYFSYSCDNCRKVFGKEPHLNISSLDLKMSYFVPDKDKITPAGGEWHRKDLLKTRGGAEQRGEFHFCNVLCLLKFIVSQPTYLESVQGERFDVDALKSIEKTLLPNENK